MKILLVITKADIGGAQVFVLNLAEMLASYGHEVVVVAGSGEYLPAELKIRNLEFVYFNSLRRGYSVLSSVLFIKDLRAFLKQNDYDVIHLNSTNTLVGVISTIFSRKKPKFVFTMHGLSFLDNNYEMNFLFKSITKYYFRLFLKFSHRTVFVSELNYKESLKANLLKMGEVILNGLPEQKLKFKSKNESRMFFSKLVERDLSNKYIVGSVGRLAYQKNYEFLLSNIPLIKRHFPDIVFIIVGDGPYYNKFQKEVNHLEFKDNFYFVGAIENSYKYIKAFDIYTLPSRYEGLSISLIEAIFAELPILASDVGGNTEIVKGDKRQLFELNNIDVYIQKLKTIIAEKDSIVEYNKKIKQVFSLENMAVNYNRLYEKLISE